MDVCTVEQARAVEAAELEEEDLGVGGGGSAVGGGGSEEELYKCIIVCPVHANAK